MQSRSAHTKFDFSYHVVFITKRRRKLLVGRRATVAEDSFKQVAQELGCAFDTLKIAINHVHMLVMIPPKLSVSQVMQHLKGKTALQLKKEFPELERELPGESIWATGFYARTVGTLNEQLVRDYIDRTDHL